MQANPVECSYLQAPEREKMLTLNGGSPAKPRMKTNILVRYDRCEANPDVKVNGEAAHGSERSNEKDYLKWKRNRMKTLLFDAPSACSKVSNWLKDCSQSQKCTTYERPQIPAAEIPRKPSILVRQDFDKARPSCDSNSSADSKRKQIKLDVPLSPESRKKSELCNYLKLMDLKSADRSNGTILTNRRSTRVKNLMIMSEKRELERKLSVEARIKEDCELSKKSFEELGIDPDAKITDVLQAVSLRNNFHPSHVPPEILSRQSDFEESIGEFVKERRRKYYKSNKENRVKEKKQIKMKLRMKGKNKIKTNKMKENRMKIKENRVSRSKIMIKENHVKLKKKTLKQRQLERRSKLVKNVDSRKTASARMLRSSNCKMLRSRMKVVGVPNLYKIARKYTRRQIVKPPEEDDGESEGERSTRLKVRNGHKRISVIQEVDEEEEDEEEEAEKDEDEEAEKDEDEGAEKDEDEEEAELDEEDAEKDESGDERLSVSEEEGVENHENPVETLPAKTPEVIEQIFQDWAQDDSLQVEEDPPQEEKQQDPYESDMEGYCILHAAMNEHNYTKDPIYMEMNELKERIQRKKREMAESDVNAAKSERVNKPGKSEKLSVTDPSKSEKVVSKLEKVSKSDVRISEKVSKSDVNKSEKISSKSEKVSKIEVVSKSDNISKGDTNKSEKVSKVDVSKSEKVSKTVTVSKSEKVSKVDVSKSEKVSKTDVVSKSEKISKGDTNKSEKVSKTDVSKLSKTDIVSKSEKLSKGDSNKSEKASKTDIVSKSEKAVESKSEKTDISCKSNASKLSKTSKISDVSKLASLETDVAKLSDLCKVSLVESTNLESVIAPAELQDLRIPVCRDSVKSLHRNLMQNKRKANGEAEIWGNSPRGSKAEKKSHAIGINEGDGAILDAQYFDYNLVVTQDLMVSFWTQSALGFMLEAQNMWIPRGSIQRLTLDNGCTRKFSKENVICAENSFAYVELWTKEHKSDKRERPVADVFAVVYYWRSRTGSEKKFLQLENINGFADDVRYVVLKNSRCILVSWRCVKDDSAISVLHCYQLAADYQTIESIRELEEVEHVISSLHNIEDCDTLVMGCGDQKVTIWNLEFGYVVATIDVSDSLPEPRNLWTKCDRGFLFMLQQYPDGSFKLNAINGINHSWKRLQVYKPPQSGFDKLQGLCVDNGILIGFYSNGILCWNVQSGNLIMEELCSDSVYWPSGKHIITIGHDNGLNVKSALSYLITNYDFSET